MKKITLPISILVYLFLILLLNKSYALNALEYDFDTQHIHPAFILMLLSIKIVFDTMLFLKKKTETIKKLSNIYYFLLLIFWFGFIPKPQDTSKALKINLQEMLAVNQSFFSLYDTKAQKLPNKAQIEAFKAQKLPLTIYTHKGKKYPYELRISKGNTPILSTQKDDKPGIFFLVLDEKKNDFYLTATILDPKTYMVSILHLGDKALLIDKKVNMDFVHAQKNQGKILQEMFIQKMMDQNNLMQ